MKKNAVKSIFAVFMAVALLFACAVNTFAETVGDQIEDRLNDLLNQYENSDDPAEQKSIEERFNEFLTKYGLDSVDLDKITETDIGKIIGDLGSQLALDDLKKLADEAFQSGYSMIKDALANGFGTADGSNTATTKPAVTSPNVIVANTAPANNNGAVGIPETNNIPPVTQESSTYNVGEPVNGNMVGAAVTNPAPTPVEIEDSGMSTTSVIVLVVLGVATLAVIVAIVIFFIKKHK